MIYGSYFEPFHSGSYITHCHDGDSPRTLCGLAVASLQTLEQVGEVITMIACPRCLAKVEADSVPRMGPEQMELLDWRQDG